MKNHNPRFGACLIRRALLFATCFALCAAPRLEATSVKPMSMREIADLSAQVCWATVTSTTPRWSNDHRAIETVVQLTDVEFLKGNGPQQFEWIIPGGTMDGMTMQLAGAPSFVAGERWMLCLLPQWKTHPCTGIWQGAFRVEQGEHGPIVRGAAGFVSGLNADATVRYSQVRLTHACRDAACGIAHSVSLATQTPEPAISVEGWNAVLKPILQGSTPHVIPDHAAVPSRVIVDSRPVSFSNVAQQTPQVQPKSSRPGAVRPRVKLTPVPVKGVTR